MDLRKAQEFARQQLAAIPPTKYEVSPQQAYEQAGSPRGPLRQVVFDVGGKVPPCPGCDSTPHAYSSGGANEVAISGMCEPCFDYVGIHPEDRDETDQRWMSLVKYTKKD